MNDIQITLFVLIAAYLLGSVPSAYIIAKLRKGIDIRSTGSRNMGAMNTFYTVGFWWGMLVLAIDIGKGALGVGIAYWMGAPAAIDTAAGTAGWFSYLPLLAGAAVLIGHNFPVFLKFRGGKGGASCIGILVVLMPWGLIVYPAAFGLLLLITRFPTMSYGLAFLSFPILAAFVYHSPPYIIYSVLIFVFLIGRYIPRIVEMIHKSGGSVKRVAMRKNIKDRM
jgi:acyl phosphate:glycerol-3-phosphate acyltransferase